MMSTAQITRKKLYGGIDLSHKPWIEKLLKTTVSSLTKLKMFTSFTEDQLNERRSRDIKSLTSSIDASYKNLVFFCGVLSGSLMQVSPVIKHQNVFHKIRH